MTLRREDPERWETFRGRYEAAVADYKAGIDSRSILGARLYGLGFRGTDIEREIALHQQDAGPIQLANTEPVRALVKTAADIEIGSLAASDELRRVLGASKEGRP